MCVGRPFCLTINEDSEKKSHTHTQCENIHFKKRNRIIMNVSRVQNECNAEYTNISLCQKPNASTVYSVHCTLAKQQRWCFLNAVAHYIACLFLIIYAHLLFMCEFVVWSQQTETGENEKRRRRQKHAILSFQWISFCTTKHDGYISLTLHSMNTRKFSMNFILAKFF